MFDLVIVPAACLHPAHTGHPAARIQGTQEVDGMVDARVHVSLYRHHRLLGGSARLRSEAYGPAETEGVHRLASPSGAY